MKPRCNFCALSMCLLLLAHSTLSTAQRFVRAPIYSAGNPSVSVASGDFNADGNVDLAFLSTSTPAVVTIRLGIGNGQFNPGQQITLSERGTSIITGDWNNDGVLDLAASLEPYVESPVAVLLGNGDGTFGPQQSYDTGAGAQYLATGDLNGDGIADLVTANLGSNISVLLGLGGGRFGSPTILNTGFYSTTYEVAIADLNGDGTPDIMAVGDDTYDGLSKLIIFLGLGDGTFNTPAQYDTTFAAAGLAIGDFNRDGIPDVAVSGELVSICLGKGDGTVNPQVTYVGTPNGGGFGGLTTADVNKDGNLDLIRPTLTLTSWVFYWVTVMEHSRRPACLERARWESDRISGRLPWPTSTRTATSMLLYPIAATATSWN